MDNNSLSKIKNFLLETGVSFEENVSLKKKTWIHRGGVVGLYISPNSETQLFNVGSFFYKNNITFEVVGHTSNIYFLNEYNPDIVISTRLCNHYTLYENFISCECGVSVSKLARECLEKGICGFEYLTELPGTVGGSIYNNSSCKTNSIGQLIVSVKLLCPDSTIRELSLKDLDYSFRSSTLKKKIIKGIILSANLHIERTDDTYALKEKASEFKKHRKENLEPSPYTLGCTFDTPFINGKLSSVYRFLYYAYMGILSLLHVPKEKKQHLQKVFFLRLTGYKDLIPYISDKTMITYIWKDEKADSLFPKYVRFMNEVLKTDKMEIEIKR